MREIIVKALVELLSILALATKLVKEKKLKWFGKKLLGNKDIEDALRRLDRLTTEEARMDTTQSLAAVHSLTTLFGYMKVDIEGGKASTKDIKAALEKLDRELATSTGVVKKMSLDISELAGRQKFIDICNWLKPPNPSDNHISISRLQYDGTKEWLIQGNLYKTWKMASPSSYWIDGKSGSGKSVLCSAIIDDIKDFCGSLSGVSAMLAYFYCDFRDVQKQGLYGLVSSLLYQLSAQSESCYNILCSKYESESCRGQHKPTETMLIQYLKDMLALQIRTYLVIDAIDECPNSGLHSQRESVLKLFDKLIGSHYSNVHICITSRPEIDIMNTLAPLVSQHMTLHSECGQMDAISLYVQSVFNSDVKFQTWRRRDKELAITKLAEQANGM
ncbi:hypothetical protein M422DRAFT_264520 [Sphaerobolus stellatus SS14]|uniref:Nephrocystin 3-like N-terminal domain-containing protein n=1 Tax=Sphaerobolus stellatus (strain SS14) TaxID=990650 RepID=A0A0C9UFL7_SPHS4|nr:hypothetical protein M422DRAFT_264520 [Sphaerobolus stellatus SS14]